MSRSYKTISHKGSIADAISGGFGDLTSLGEECREVFDNMPESLQPGDRGQTMDTTASELESLNEPDVPDCADGLECSWGESVPTRKGRSAGRGVRRDNAVAMLQAAAEAADTHATLLREQATEARDNVDDDASEEVRQAAETAAEKLESDADELDQLKSDLDDAVSSAEGCDFPGMYG